MSGYNLSSILEQGTTGFRVLGFLGTEPETDTPTCYKLLFQLCLPLLIAEYI